MAMTREQVLAQMEEDYAQMDEEFRNEVLFTERDINWTPTLLIEEVRNDTEYGKLYVQSWSRAAEERALLDGLLSALLGDNPQTCGDPDCPNCHGEVRPLLGDTGTEPTKH